MNNEYNHPAGEPPLLLEEELYTYEHAAVGQRFVNYLIDGVVINLALYYAFMYALGFILAATHSSLLDEPDLENSVKFNIISWTVALSIYPLYSAICEKTLNGRTLGKLASGTRALRLDGQELTWKNAILRGLCRLIPFEAFSAFSGNPWHDRFTDTAVVKTR